MNPIQGKNLINGEWTVSSQVFESTNPANIKESIGTAPASGADEVNAAVAAAKAAYATWRDLSWVNRAEIIDNFAQLLKRDIQNLGEFCTR